MPHLTCCGLAVSERWSANSDLIDAIEHVSRQALFEVAEREERSRRGRRPVVPVFPHPRGAATARDPVGRLLVPVEGESACCAMCLRARAAASTAIMTALLTQTVELLRGQTGRRGHSVLGRSWRWRAAAKSSRKSVPQPN